MDKYDREIERLTGIYEREGRDAFQNEVFNCWQVAGVLFAFATPYAHAKRADHKQCGCLTMIRSHSPRGANAWTDELTAEIEADDRLPLSPQTTEPHHLQPLAERNRWLDRELKRA